MVIRGCQNTTTTKRKWKGRLAFALNDDDEDQECDVFSGSW